MRILLDTNVLVSAILYGGKPREVLRLVLSGQAVGITSEILIFELVEVLRLKFDIGLDVLDLLGSLVDKTFIVTNPSKTIRVLHDEPDNRVLEAALAGKCDYIVTGDKDLLRLSEYKKTKIVSITDFLS